MKVFTKTEVEVIQPYLDQARMVAKRSNCQRSRCGAIIVKGGKIIGSGYNSPPGEREDQRRCRRKHELKNGFKSDRTCCMHAEQRAIMDALRHNPIALAGSTMYFCRLEPATDKPELTVPYCTICSKLTLDAGVSYMVLPQVEGLCLYPTAEYNDASFGYPV